MRTRLVLVLRLGPTGAAFGPYYSVSLALHGTFVLGLFLAPSLRPRPVPLGDVLIAEMVGDLPGPASEPASPGAAAPLAAVVPHPEEVRAETREVKPQEPSKKKEDKKRKEKEKKREPKDEPVRPGPQSTSPAPTHATPGPAGGPGTLGGKADGGITSLDTGDVEFAWYRASVIAALRSHWIRPVLEETQGTLVAQATFEVRRDGTVQNSRIETSSGVPVMDRSVLRALVECSPFPPLPLTWRDPILTARVEFRLQPDSP